MGTCVHFSRSLPSNSWWQTMVGWQVLSRPSAAEGGSRRPAFTGLAAPPYSATEVDGWQHKLSRVSQNRAAVHIYGGIIPDMKKGDVLGHENMGEVVEVGSENKALKVGDRVVVPFTISCGECFFCRNGFYSGCER